MLEIGAMIYLCSRMRNLLYERGWERTGWMQTLVVVVYLVSLVFGVFVYAVNVVIRDGEAAAESIGFMAYPPALLSAVVGQFVLFGIVKAMVRKPEEDLVMDQVSESELVAEMPMERTIEREFGLQPEPLTDAPRNSRWGLASFAIGCLAWVSTTVLFVTLGAMEASNPGALGEGQSLLVGLMTIVFLLMSVVSLGLGVSGLIKKRRRRVFAVLGTVISALNLLGFGMLMIIG